MTDEEFRARALAVLAKVEWSGGYEALMSVEFMCPVCEAKVNAPPGDPGMTHRPDCELAALLGTPK